MARAALLRRSLAHLYPTAEYYQTMRTARTAKLLIVAFGALGCLSIGGAAPRAAMAQSGEPWRLVQPAQSSLVFAADGSLIGEIGKEWRTSVSLRSLPGYLPDAFIAVEDKRFYEHNGVDPIGVLGALKDAATGHARGASTITQLLVGNMHPDIIDRRDRSIGRKLREQEAALEMERHYTKEQILEAFLNQLDFGHNWFGVESAARHFFGKSAARLSIAEAATLAAMPKSPSEYDPTRHPDRAKRRRDLIIGLMAEQGYITPAMAKIAKAEPLVTVPDGGMSAPSSYYVDVVRQQLERAGIPVQNGGFRVYTVLDPELQRDAVQALVDGTARVESRPGYMHPRYTPGHAMNDVLQGAVIAMSPQTGDVRALVGGRNYALAPFDRAVNARRQPGSAIKPIVYAKAIEDSIPANAIIPDTALAITLPNGDVYRPEDFEGTFAGPMTIREALAESRNSVAIQLGLRVGMDSVAALAKRMGIESPIAPYPSSAIGASVVRPIELVAAYTAFDNGGSVVEPRFVARVEDLAGRVIYARPPSTPRQVLDPRVAFIVRDMMGDVVDHGTGASARRAVPSTVPIAGKTGTTNDNTDVWFVGMTPELVAGVWLGFDRPQTITPGAVGGTLAAPIWGQMVARWYANRKSDAFPPPPPGLTYAAVDRATGQFADTTTPPERRYIEYFLDGAEPAALATNPWKFPLWSPIVVH